MKQYRQYQMNFTGKCAGYSAACMGLSMFLAALYYLGLNYLADTGAGELIFCLWLPLVSGTAYLVLLRVMRWNAPGTYAIIGAVFCVISIFGSFAVGAGRGVFAIPVYLICAAVLLVVVGGFFPSSLPVALVFGIAIVLRILLLDIGRLSLVQWVREGAHLFAMGAFVFLPGALTRVKNRKELT